MKLWFLQKSSFVSNKNQALLDTLLSGSYKGITIKIRTFWKDQRQIKWEIVSNFVCCKLSFPIRSKSLYIYLKRPNSFLVGLDCLQSSHATIRQPTSNNCLFALLLAAEYVNSTNLNLSLHPTYFSLEYIVPILHCGNHF